MPANDQPPPFFKRTIMAANDPPFPFFKLAPELRIYVYELAFTNNDVPDLAIDLTKAQFRAPKKDLLMTCKQINAEARGIYKRSFRAFWQGNSFVVDNRIYSDEYARDLIAFIPVRDLDHIPIYYQLRIASETQPNAGQLSRATIKPGGLVTVEVFDSLLSPQPVQQVLAYFYQGSMPPRVCFARVSGPEDGRFQLFRPASMAEAVKATVGE